MDITADFVATAAIDGEVVYFVSEFPSLRSVLRTGRHPLAVHARILRI
jgi:hypothetical protein